MGWVYLEISQQIICIFGSIYWGDMLAPNFKMFEYAILHILSGMIYMFPKLLNVQVNATAQSSSLSLQSYSAAGWYVIFRLTVEAVKEGKLELCKSSYVSYPTCRASFQTQSLVIHIYLLSASSLVAAQFIFSIRCDGL